MNTLKQFLSKLKNIPATTAWYLSDLGESRGRQDLFTKQAPQRLKVLRQSALIESAVSSNRIEGVTVAPSRVGAVVLGKSLLHDRDEEEVRGYRNALNLIHEKNPSVSASETKKFMKELVTLWDRCLKERLVHPLILLASFNLDFLCIHPFRDGNGRVSRLLLLLQLYHLGYEAGRYISLERLIEQNKERYYETLEQSSQGWHEGRQDPWPYINFILFILKEAYREFEQRVGQVKSPKGAKTELIEAAIGSFKNNFTLSDLEKACPSVSRDMTRKVLRDLKKKRKIECLGRGPGAFWGQRVIPLKEGKRRGKMK